LTRGTLSFEAAAFAREFQRVAADEKYGGQYT
jgi:hypothetical protein